MNPQEYPPVAHFGNEGGETNKEPVWELTCGLVTNPCLILILMNLMNTNSKLRVSSSKNTMSQFASSFPKICPVPHELV